LKFNEDSNRQPDHWRLASTQFPFGLLTLKGILDLWFFCQTQLCNKLSAIASKLEHTRMGQRISPPPHAAVAQRNRLEGGSSLVSSV